MPDDPRFYPPDDNPDDSRRDPAPDSSASGEFERIMRRAAERRSAPPPETPIGDEGDDADALVDEIEETLAAEPVPQPPRRRRRRAVRNTVGVFGGLFRSFIVVAAAAGLTATIFTWWTPTAFLSQTLRDDLSAAIIASAEPTTLPTTAPTPNWARRIGIVSGHRGPQNDPGAVCPDGLTEASINFNVAQQVVRNLRGRGYTVDLLDEFDPRLDNYQAAALVSIHANTCQDFGEPVSGFLIAAAAARVSARGTDELLVGCVARHYAVASGLQRRDGVTVDMTDYHTFREIHPLTAAAIIELGFMLADRQILTERPDLLAAGITDGILCFLEPGINNPTPDATRLSPLATFEPGPTLDPAELGDG
jgi:N-acetylmuramoyl-L-alanine amidase